MQKEKSYKKNSYFLNLLEKKMLPYCNKVAFIEKTELTNKISILSMKQENMQEK